MDPQQNTRRLANAWIRHPRRGGQPQHNLRHSYRKALVAIGEIEASDTKAPFKEWTKNIADLPKGHWREEVRKRLRKWSATEDLARAEERTRKKQRIQTVGIQTEEEDTQIQEQ